MAYKNVWGHSMVAFRFKRMIGIFTISIATSMLATCVMVDGLYKYVLEGRLLYESGIPLDGIDVNVLAAGLIEASIVPRDGYFNESLYGGMWGGEQFLFIRFYDIPEPPLLDNIVFILETETESYLSTIDVSAEMQARVEGTTRWINVGDVILKMNPQN